MDSGDSPPHDPAEPAELPPMQCDACEGALQSPERDMLSFLLVDQLTAPIIGCDDHRQQFASICGYTTDATADLLDHRPAGGVRCPSCGLAAHTPHQPLVPVAGGAVAILVCPEHQSELINRFRTGLDTHHQLTTQLDTAGPHDVL
ncbi:hypothetical protein [Halobacterium bonnevillei]|jgi:hypothetical protein|uniref:Uncharacterized protein n=1 Tax=Halobacterium bonnevillei TaxID=2692200 RepID=A0A6B0SDI5_9EURY|nr:hypothetical protein [Halobacterium bonnevillei]MXR19458.1 hypothetical protein [Halobacterium bonnevillei]